MAIDPRIALGLRFAPQVNVADIFNRVRKQNQDLAIGKQNLELGELNIDRETSTNETLVKTQAQDVVRGGLQNDTLTGTNLDAKNNRILKSAHDFAVKNQSVINDAVNNNDPAPLQQLLAKRQVDLKEQGLPTDETDEAIAMLGQGDLQGVVGGMSDAVNLYQGQQGQGASAGMRERTGLLADYKADPNSPAGQSAGVALGITPRAGTSAQERIPTDAVLSAQVVAQKAAETQAVEQAKSDARVAETLRLEQQTEGGRQAVEAKRLNIDETKITNENRREEAINSKNAKRAEADSAVEQIGSLLAGDRFSSAFGKLVTLSPDIAKSQESIDAIADINQIKGLITLESREKLKGQGQISDGEAKTLEQSATVLNNPLISDERARRELRKIRGVFEASSDRNQLKKETKEKPVVIKFDAEGNQIQ